MPTDQSPAKSRPLGVPHCRTIALSLISIATLTALAGCATDQKTATFITKTSLSILDADSTPPNISIAYNRDEGYFGPRYESGAVPSVLASIRSDGNIFDPQVMQLYATGNAAEIAAGRDPAQVTVDSSQMTGDTKRMIFGTTTTVGFKVDVGPNSTPKGLLFGFRRKEVSVIPLATAAKSKADQSDVHAYPSVIAAIDTTARSTREQDTLALNLDNRQFFATGIAAEAMAIPLRNEFLKRAEQDAGANGLAQRLAAAELLTCYAGLRVADRPDVWRDADSHNLFYDTLAEPRRLELMLTAYRNAVDESGNLVDSDRLARIDRLYSHHLLTVNISDPNRLDAIKAHHEKTCALSRNNQP